MTKAYFHQGNGLFIGRAISLLFLLVAVYIGTYQWEILD